jgi:hypothetical protein
MLNSAFIDRKYRHEVTLFPELHEVKRSEDPYEYGGPWTKDNPLCRKQAMKIITPCYPQANTTSKVSNLQLLAIKTELSRGLALAQSIVDFSNMSEVLDRLLSPFSFFDRYTHYIMITASAETKVQLLDSKIVSFCLHFHSTSLTLFSGFIFIPQRRHQHVGCWWPK